MNKLQLSIVIVFFSFLGFSQKEYVKEYYPNGNLKEEGWISENKKTDYWYFYNSDGTKIQEGHFKEDKKVKWWIFYDSEEITIKKCEFVNNLPDGFCLLYDNGKLKKAEKYDNGKLIKSWTDLNQFKKDNNI